MSVKFVSKKPVDHSNLILSVAIGSLLTVVGLGAVLLLVFSNSDLRQQAATLRSYPCGTDSDCPSAPVGQKYVCAYSICRLTSGCQEGTYQCTGGDELGICKNGQWGFFEHCATGCNSQENRCDKGVACESNKDCQTKRPGWVCGIPNGGPRECVPPTPVVLKNCTATCQVKSGCNCFGYCSLRNTTFGNNCGGDSGGRGG